MSPKCLFEAEGLFLHSDALRQAVYAYSELFDFPVIPGLCDGPIYVLELAGGLKLILDDYRFDTHHFDPKPAYVLTSPELEEALFAVKRCKFEITLPIVKGTGMNFFLFRGEDEHVFAVCDRQLPYRTAADPSDGERHVLKDIYLPVRHVAKAYEKYASIMQGLVCRYDVQDPIRAASSVRLKLVPRTLRPQWPRCRIRTAELPHMQTRLRQNPHFRLGAADERMLEVWDSEGNGLVFEERRHS